MKKLVRNITTLGFALSVFTGYSTEPMDTNTDVNDPVEKEVKNDQDILVKNSKGKIVLRTTIGNEENLTELIQLKSLSNGYYILELEKDFEIDILPIKIKDEKVNILDNDEYVYFKPVVRQKEDLIFISKLNFNHSPVSIKLLYNDYNGTSDFIVINSETISSDDTLERVYKIDDKEKGNYKVIVTSEDRRFTNTFKI